MNISTGVFRMNVDKTGSTKEDLRDFKEEIVRQFHIISEDVISHLKVVAEGVLSVDEKVERTRLELKSEIHEIRKENQEIRVDVQEIRKENQEIRGEVQEIRSDVQDIRKENQEIRSDVQEIRSEIQEIRIEVQETRKEILAAVKFSYAELDKRLTTLERDFLELKLRIEKVENRSIS